MQNKGRTEKTSDEHLLVVLGAHNLYVVEEEKVSRNVSYSIIHDTWKPHKISFTGDIAALKLSEPVEFNKSIQPVCLADQLEDLNKIKNASIGVLYGWGNNETEVLQSTPFKVELPINDKYNCTFENPYISDLVWDKSFCAGKNGAGACSGDSGSGIYVEMYGKYFLRGIVSSSEARRCGTTSEAIFSDAIEYRDFIEVRRIF